MKIFILHLLILIASGCKSIIVSKNNEGSQEQRGCTSTTSCYQQPARHSEGDFITLKDYKYPEEVYFTLSKNIV